MSFLISQLVSSPRSRHRRAPDHWRRARWPKHPARGNRWATGAVRVKGGGKMLELRVPICR